MHLLHTRQLMLVLSVWFFIAFPWACMRHCAMHATSMHHSTQSVCQLQFQGSDSVVWSATLGSNSAFGGPTLTLFILTSSIVLRYGTQMTTYHHTSLRWQTCFLATPVPPPKSV
jgi:hypothetical protein